MNKKVVGSLLGVAMLALPFAALAETSASTSAQGGIFISGSGIVHAIRAEVTGIAGSIISAVSHLGSTMVSWTITTDANTKFGKHASSTAGIAVGDKINVTGALTGIGSTISVSATKVREVGSKFMHRVLFGSIASIDAATSSFVVSHGNKNARVVTSASTTFSLDGLTSAFSSLFVGERVGVFGTTDASTSVITATQVNGRTQKQNDDNEVNDQNRGRGASFKSFLHLRFGERGEGND